jgi:nucleoid DNA-binding protein
MGKEDLIRKISKDSKIKTKKTSKIFDRVFELISKDLKRKKIVSIRDFGEFKIKKQEMKITVNKNDTRIVMPPKDIVEFNVSGRINYLKDLNG